MPIMRTAVLLFRSIRRQFVRAPGWYHDYFFNMTYGQAGYWLTQTSGDVLFSGQVFDWLNMGTNPAELSSRHKMLEYAIRTMEDVRGVNFGGFESIVLVLAVPSNVSSDGGSTTVNSGSGRTHAATVIRQGDRYDFVAHELGHHIPVAHTYGSPLYKNAPWSQPGEYGHPYCVMSAMGYGGVGSPYFPAAPRDGASEYTGLGPSLNAGTAVGRNWLPAHSWNLTSGQAGEFVIRSRQWWPKSPSPPPAVLVNGFGGHTFVIEYRQNTEWDAGMTRPAVIVNHLRGSSADIAAPDLGAAKFVGEIRLPITIGSGGTIVNAGGVGIEVIEWASSQWDVRLRLSPHPVEAKDINLTSTVTALSRQWVGFGQETFRRGEVLCIEGTWEYRIRHTSQVATFDLTYNDSIPFHLLWDIEGQYVTGASGTVNVTTQVRVVSPRFEDKLEMRTVTLRYEIQPKPNGGILRLFNRPQDGTFTVAVGCEFGTSVGSAQNAGWANFKGIEYVYRPQFYEERDRCLDHIRGVIDRYKRYKVLMEPDLWKRVHPRVQQIAQKYLDVLTVVGQRDGRRQYNRVLNMMAQTLGLASVPVLRVSRSTVRRVQAIECPALSQAPGPTPAPPPRKSRKK